MVTFLPRLGRIRTGPLGFPRGEAGRLDGSSEPARLTEEGWRQPKYCLHFVQWYQSRLLPLISHCSDSFTTWRTALIKQAPFSTHRTLHETLGARHPSSVSPLGCQLPPGGSQGGTVRIRLGYHEAIGAYRETPQSAPLGLPAQLCIKQLYAIL